MESQCGCSNNRYVIVLVFWGRVPVLCILGSGYSLFYKDIWIEVVNSEWVSWCVLYHLCISVGCELTLVALVAVSTPLKDDIVFESFVTMCED